MGSITQWPIHEGFVKPAPTPESVNTARFSAEIELSTMQPFSPEEYPKVNAWLWQHRLPLAQAMAGAELYIANSYANLWWPYNIQPARNITRKPGEAAIPFLDRVYKAVKKDSADLIKKLAPPAPNPKPSMLTRLWDGTKNVLQKLNPFSKKKKNKKKDYTLASAPLATTPITQQMPRSASLPPMLPAVLPRSAAMKPPAPSEQAHQPLPTPATLPQVFQPQTIMTPN